VATTKNNYTSWSSLTVSLNSLASASARQSAVVDNSSNLYLDILLGGGFKTASGSLGSNPNISIYVSALSDGTNYGGSYGSNTLGGGDAAFTMPTNTGNLKLASVVPINVAASTEYMEPVSISALFGGTLPSRFCVVFQNNTGLALDSSAGGAAEYLGVTTTTA
jgi:hypothetical protein